MTDGLSGDDWAAPGQREPSARQVPDAGSPVPSAAPPAVVTAAAPAQPVPTYRSWQPGIMPLRPVGFGEFIALPFKAMRFNRAVVVGGPLLFVGGSMVLLAAAMWLAFTDPSLALLAPTSQLQGVQGSTVAVAAAAVLALVLADALSAAVVAPGVARAVLGERIGVGNALRAVRPRIGQLLLLWLLSSVAVLLAIAPGVAAMILGAQAGDDAVVAVGLLAAAILGLSVGLPVYIVSAAARCVIVLERTGAIASVRRTVGLIKGRFWWSFLIIAVTGLIIYLITAVVQQLFTFVAAIALAIGFEGQQIGIVVAVAVATVATVATYVFTYAYMGSVYALIYIDLRIRHEGFDLDLARAAEARRG